MEHSGERSTLLNAPFTVVVTILLPCQRKLVAVNERINRALIRLQTPLFQGSKFSLERYIKRTLLCWCFGGNKQYSSTFSSRYIAFRVRRYHKSMLNWKASRQNTCIWHFTLTGGEEDEESCFPGVYFRQFFPYSTTVSLFCNRRTFLFNYNRARRKRMCLCLS